MNRKPILLAALLVIVMVLGVLGSGCLAGGTSEANHKVVVSSIGNVSYGSNQKLSTMEDLQKKFASPSAVSKMAGMTDTEKVISVFNGTWICMITDNSTDTSIGAMTVARAKDLSKLDISVKLPDGKDAHASNFQLKKDGDGWILDADHSGFNMAGAGEVESADSLSPGEQSTTNWDKEPIKINDEITEDQNVIVILGIDIPKKDK